MVNSESRLLGNLVKKDRVDFTSEVVEKVYEFLPSEQKYIMDEVGDVWRLDPVGVVRTALESMQYQMDPTWYSYGTKASKLVNNIKIGESIKWNEVKDFFFSTEYYSEYKNYDFNKKVETQNKILGLKPDASRSERIQRFNELNVDQWYKNCYKEIIDRIKSELPTKWKKYLQTLSITTYITKDGFIQHIIAPQGKSTSYYTSKITEWINQKYGNDDIIVLESPNEIQRKFIAPEIFRATENHAEVKIFEYLINQRIAKNSKIFMVANRRMCITCRIVGEQFKILSQTERNDNTVEVYRGEDQDSTIWEYWEENDEIHFKQIYREFFESLVNKYPTLEINIEEQLDRLWNLFGYRDPLDRVLSVVSSFKI